MGLFHRHRHSHTVVKASLAKVLAGCTVRMNVQILDGGVALDWTDSRLSYNDLYIWSDARRGIIGKPTWEVDSDDPTLLHVTYTTASTDLPGTHKLTVDVSYDGWQMIHTVIAYWLVGNLYVPGSGTRVVTSEEVVETDLTFTLHDVSTTYLQSLIDELIALRQGESEKVTVLEGLVEQLNESGVGGNVEIVDSLPESGEDDMVYVDRTTRAVYIWDGEKFVCVGIGESNIIDGGDGESSDSGNNTDSNTGDTSGSTGGTSSGGDYLPLTGGTLTGDLTVTGKVTVTDRIVLPSGVEIY